MAGKPLPPSVRLDRAVRRFWDKIDMSDPDGCWIWTACTNPNGYGEYYAGGERGSSTTAHRFMASAILGWSIEGKMVCHHCDNPPCVNPWHLYVGDNGTNQRDAVARGRWSSGNTQKTHCKRGHEFTTENTRVNPRGERVCRACDRTLQREYKERKRKRLLISDD